MSESTTTIKGDNMSTERAVITPEVANKVIIGAIEARSALRGVVYGDRRDGDRSEYRYIATHTICSNFEGDGAPSCIVGHVLANWGFTKDDGLSGSVGPTMDELEFQYPNWEITREARAVLAAAQGAQDCGATWGEALAAAHSVCTALTRTPGASFSGTTEGEDND